MESLFKHGWDALRWILGKISFANAVTCILHQGHWDGRPIATHSICDLTTLNFWFSCFLLLSAGGSRRALSCWGREGTSKRRTVRRPDNNLDTENVLKNPQNGYCSIVPWPPKSFALDGKLSQELQNVDLKLSLFNDLLNTCRASLFFLQLRTYLLTGLGDSCLKFQPWRDRTWKIPANVRLPLATE